MKDVKMILYVLCMSVYIVLNTRYNCFVYYVIWLYVLLIIVIITVNFSYNKNQVYFDELATVQNFSRCKTKTDTKVYKNPFNLYLFQKYKLYRVYLH